MKQEKYLWPKAVALGLIMAAVLVLPVALAQPVTPANTGNNPVSGSSLLVSGGLECDVGIDGTDSIDGIQFNGPPGSCTTAGSKGYIYLGSGSFNIASASDITLTVGAGNKATVSGGDLFVNTAQLFGFTGTTNGISYTSGTATTNIRADGAVVASFDSSGSTITGPAAVTGAISIATTTTQGIITGQQNDATTTSGICSTVLNQASNFTAGDCLVQMNSQNGDTLVRLYQGQGMSVTMGTGGGFSSLVGLANATTADVTSSGASNLISYTLPANSLNQTNRCLRIKGWGTALNNANAKTVALDFGSQTIISKILTPSIANTTWSFQATVCRSGSNTQDIYAEAWNPMGTTVSSVDANTVLYQAARTAGTQTDTANITIKGKTTTATTTDVTMDGLTVEFM